MDKADIAALLALGAALFIAIGDVIHQRSAHEVTDEQVSHLQLFLRLLSCMPTTYDSECTGGDRRSFFAVDRETSRSTSRL